jgi:signal transduction histidine kinase
MLHEFLDANRAELIERCRAKVARRPAPRPTPKEMEHGIPLFLGQLIETLRIAQGPDALESRKVSGLSGPAKRHVQSDIATSAAKHGHELLRKGFTVDQVVYDYGDLCQAVSELAGEKNAPFSPDEFQALNGCLDNAIADAVTEFGWQRDQLISEMGNRAMSERLGFLAHELRNLLNTAMLSFAAIKGGTVAINGATSAVLDRSLVGLRDLIDHALADVRLAAGVPLQLDYVAVGQFIAEVQVAASLEAKDKGCEFTVSSVEPGLAIHVDKQLLYSAVSNLLQNAFKFTRSHGHVSLKAYGTGDRVLIEVKDQCGGLPEGKAEAMFHSFEQHGADRSGLGLGLSISRRAVEASGGELRVRDIPGIGCVFTIDLPRRSDAAGSRSTKA